MRMTLIQTSNAKQIYPFTCLEVENFNVAIQQSRDKCKMSLLIFVVLSFSDLKTSVLKCLSARRWETIFLSLCSKFSSEAYFNFMHLAFVNGWNKRNFMLCVKRSKKRLLTSLEPFSLNTSFLLCMCVKVYYFLLPVWQLMVVFVTVCHGCHRWL